MEAPLINDYPIRNLKARRRRWEVNIAGKKKKVNRDWSIIAQGRRMVKEVTLDMASSMNLIVKKCFPKATRVIDRFHVQRLACDVVQELRIKHRWEAIDQDNAQCKQAKKEGKEHTPLVLENGDTLKQLLVRSRCLLFKPSHKWTESQKIRANLLFNIYPDIESAYDLSHHLYLIYSRNIEPPVAMTHLALWFNQIEITDLPSFPVLKKLLKHIIRTSLTSLKTEAPMLQQNPSIQKLKTSEDNLGAFLM
ncbi:Transposase [Saccharicrinis carchari]|uniref:Transposase n=1 Tax=Saccharicrinis carchari TaxID=1168039 RepID=A0A521D574_SACCC|nr:transposase [Saccharicrinis carchari]SMO66762.1 Transposase [Saccharicrinis carchari]